MDLKTTDIGAELADVLTDIYCPECGANQPARNGWRSGQQLYKCRKCGRQFGGGQYLSGDRFPDAVKADAVRQCYRGLTTREAAAYVMRMHEIRDTEIAPSSVMRWVRRYTNAAIEATKGLKATAGDTWTIDHSAAIDIGAVCWQMLDKESGYLLGVHYYPRTEDYSLAEVIDDAIAAAESTPRQLLSRCGLGNCSVDSFFVEAIRDAFPEIKVCLSDEPANLAPTVYGPDGREFEGEAPTNKLAHLKSFESIRSYFQGWAVSYNFIEPKADGRRPPGSTAVADPPFSSWREVVDLERRTRNRRRAG